MPCYGNPSIEPYDGNNISVNNYADGAKMTDSFWDLPLYFQIITIVAIILALGWKIVALLTAWAKKDPKNENRLKILNFIENNPGSTVNMIEKDLDLKRGTVRYHVNALKDAGKILLFRNGNYVSMFRNESDLWNKSHGQTIEPHLQGVMCKKVCRLIFENPGITNMELSERLGISKGTVRSHIRTLEDMDCLEVETSGKFKNYYIREDYHPDTLPFFERVQ
ncbi:winged helix-turn-helix transcriptional regulator [Methanolobus mangrovi]|uniref:Winged helix-turn-helix transcriptional regulator n=1 Tax=Methanolobus mangrovi TaxID=3072977 RepID=A0AA51UJF4_9EURY|nr:winged helix-turn-helix transcriptional regulator [Methanolobus mangrovi]WMW23212.1 winged helix-turn-helix transcriptional regulator [Methanolobus mangrovi]